MTESDSKDTLEATNTGRTDGNRLYWKDSLMTQNLNPTDVAAWMRHQARQFTKMAEQIESTFKLNGQAAAVQSSEALQPLADRIVGLLKVGKQRRVASIAGDLGVKESEVQLAINLSDSLSRGGRGWISISKEEVMSNEEGLRG